MDVKEVIIKMACEKFYILDTTQDGLSDKIIYNDGDITYHRYCYNVHKYNKLVEGSIFLYRQTKRSSKKRKFYFFGGGIVSSIKKVDDDGNVEAIISNGFKFIEPVYEDNIKLDEINWTSKVKTKGKWAYFWNQYGMNEITKEEFLGIIDGVECVDAEQFYKESFVAEFTEENKSVFQKKKMLDEFIGIYTKNGNLIDNNVKRKIIKRNYSARKIDFNSLNNTKKTLGTFGEILIYNDEMNKVLGYDFNKKVEHVALTKGDGLGYDIISYNENGEEVYIEVKTTISNKVDSFYLSPKEIEVANNKNNYKVYRVYNLDMIEGTYNVEIYDSKDIKEMFELVPVSYKAVKKKN